MSTNSSEILLPLLALSRIRDNFLDELRRSSDGKKTSLAFIKNTLPSQPLVKDNQPFQVMVIGGSRFTNALVKKENNSYIILQKEKSALPRFDVKEQFFDFFQRNLEKNVSKVALNFAYGLDPIFREGVLDGKFLGRSKENRFEGLAGKAAGQELKNYVYKTSQKKIQISVANDTICLLLAGFEKDDKKNLASYVVGSGTNSAFFIDKSTLVNLESGSFSTFTQTETGKIIDIHSAAAGLYRFEKEVSGLYLYQHFNLLRKELSINHPPLLSTKALSFLARKNDGKASLLAQKLLERSASLVASQIAGIYLYKNQPKLTFVMEGSVFWKGYRYKENVLKYVRELGVGSAAIQLVRIENSSILGAARLIG